MHLPRLRAPSLLLALALGSLACAPAWAACSASTPQKQRDATCSGQGFAGSASSPVLANPNLSGSINRNATPLSSHGTFSSLPTNSCVMSGAFTKTALTTSAPPSYLTVKSFGFIGYGSSLDPTLACLAVGGNLYASCAAWVPAQYPYILHQGSLSLCDGPEVNGSVRCDHLSESAYVSLNPAATPLYAYAISCAEPTLPSGMTIGGAPVASWATCPAGSSCAIQWETPDVND